MKLKEHPIEAAWLRFRKKHSVVLNLTERLFESEWGKHHPGLDMSMIAGVPTTIVETAHTVLLNGTDDIQKAKRIIVGDLGGPGRMAFVQTASAFLAYRADKRIVRIDKRLFESLKNTRFPDKFLTSNLVLPARSVVLTLDGESKSILAYFDMTSPDTGEPELVFKLSEYDHNAEDFRLILAFVVKEDQTLQDAIESHIKWMLSRHKEIQSVRSEDAGYLSLFGAEKIQANFVEKYSKHVRDSLVEINGYLNCILYSIGNSDIVTSTASTRKTSNDPEKAKRFRDLSPQTHSVVGSQYGRVVQRFLDEEREAVEKSAGGGASKRPHIRSGHAHIYWKNHPTVKGKKIQIVHYLPPTVVGKDWDKEADDPTNTKLK